MGCDIHLYVETKSPDFVYDDESLKELKFFNIMPVVGERISDIHLGRNYAIFGLFFDVRNYWDFEAEFCGRGLPEGVSEEISVIGSDGDTHSITYFNIVDMVDWYDSNKETIFVDVEGKDVSVKEWMGDDVEEFFLDVLQMVQVLNYLGPWGVSRSREDAKRILGDIRTKDDTNYNRKKYAADYRFIVGFDN